MKTNSVCVRAVNYDNFQCVCPFSHPIFGPPTPANEHLLFFNGSLKKKKYCIIKINTINPSGVHTNTNLISLCGVLWLTDKIFASVF